SPLPVTQVDFKAALINKKVITSWQTYSEINTERFEIYRSQDHEHFNLEGHVAAAGNSSALLNYQFTDNEPFAGTSYYKLKIIDRDGRYAWSNVVRVSFSVENVILLYPNPSHDYVTLQVDKVIADHSPIATIYDSKGSVVYSFKIISTSQQLNISAFSQGRYQLVFIIGNDKHTLPFNKN
ncbi:MAG: T9SS type A sorting domain-containing protein, partial [Ginsengibacter sp.]